MKQLADLIKRGWVAFGDFNLTQEVRTRLYAQEPELMQQLQFAFGAQKRDISFVTFPHDRVPYNVLLNAEDAILDQNEEGCNCVAPLDAICGQVYNCRRFLPWAPFTEVCIDRSVDDIVWQLQTPEGRPPQNVCDWASDHWILTFTV